MQEKQADEERLQQERNRIAERRKEEEEKIAAQVANLPAWKQKLVAAKLMAKLDAELPKPESLKAEDLPAAPESSKVRCI